MGQYLKTSSSGHLAHANPTILDQKSTPPTSFTNSSTHALTLLLDTQNSHCVILAIAAYISIHHFDYLWRKDKNNGNKLDMTAE